MKHDNLQKELIGNFVPLHIGFLDTVRLAVQKDIEAEQETKPAPTLSPRLHLAGMMAAAMFSVESINDSHVINSTKNFFAIADALIDHDLNNPKK
jgi:hypothetical protein